MPVRSRRSFSDRVLARGRLYRTKSCPTGKLYRKEADPDDREEGEWCLVSPEGYNFTLPKTMIFLGREECDVEVQCESVDKRHAVVTFDHYLRRFKVKDLSTVNGTFVNGTRIPEQEYVTLDHQDALQLGHASTMYHVEHIEDRPVRIAESTEHLLSPSDSDLPSWASPKEDESPMAECKGCIVEQAIEHTCGESIPESETARHDLDRSLSHDSIVSFSLGCNTWPKKRYKPKKHVKELFDIMNSEESNNVEGLIDPAQARVLRGRGAPMNILPAELETVKKGTPLYGQPEWWGEEESDLNLGKFRSNGSMEHTPGALTSPDRDGVKSLGDERNAVSTASGDKITQNGVQDSEHTPKEETALSPVTPEGISTMAFTVDFGDDDSKKSMDGRSLSDFMPSKIRKSFRERKEKTAEKSAEKAAKSAEKPVVAKLTKAAEKSEAIHNTQSKNLGRAVSEGRDISPTRQHKIDEIWNSSMTSSKDTSHSKRSTMMTKSSVSRSVDLDDLQLDSPSAKATKTSVKRRPPISATLTKPKSVIRARKTQSQEFQPTQLNDSTSYLIDKMFQNSTGSVDSLKSKQCDSTITEHDMYSESRDFDSQRSLKVSKDLVKYESERSLKVTKDLINKTSAKQQTEGAPAPIFKKSTEKSAKKEDEKEKEVDKVSESGTYTIELEKDSVEEDEARRNIDRVFGVDQLSTSRSMEFSDDLGQTRGDKGEHLEATLKNINSELEEIEKLEKLRAQKPPADSLDVEIGSAAQDDLLSDNEENPSTAVPSDAPKWVSQWAALTSQKTRKNSSGDMELSSPGSSISDDSKTAVRVNGISKKRPGTGRRLPTIPPVATSPATSEGGIIKESPKSSKSDLTVNGTTVTPRQRGVKISSHVSARYEDTETESISPTKTESGSESVRDKLSVASLDTEVLLRDTQTVMAAMEQRVGARSHHKQDKSLLSNGHVPFITGSDINDELAESINLNESVSLDASIDLDSDTSSCVALVNGDEDFVKPSYFKSPRESLGRAKLKLKQESLPSKPVIDMSGASSKTSNKKHSVDEGKSVVSDVFSDVNGDLSTRTSASEASTEAAQFVRQGSKGKGQMSMTRPNRAFQLRRARADDEIETPKSASTLSISSTGFSSNRTSGSLSNVSKIATTPQKPKRPMSGKYAEKHIDSARSQGSLGAQIVQKSRENQANFQRADGGRHSLRVTRSMTIPTQQASTPSTSSRSSRQSSTTPSSSSLRHSSSLRITGVSAKERSSSVTRNKTESPKSAERNAWKRRKEYDPRRAVAEAKTKKETSRRKREIDLYNQRQVTRSASFTNTRDLNLKLSAYSQNDSISSADDLSRRSSATSDVFDDHSPKRGFVPYSGRSFVSSNATSNIDEYEIDNYSRSSSTQSYDTIIVSSIYQLSLKLKTCTDRTLDKLREKEMIENGTDSPVEDEESQSAVSEIPAYKSANQELAGVLKNLRKLEKHIKVMNRALFPDDTDSPDTSKEKHEYLQQIERIRNELAGFQPIETPRTDAWKHPAETASVESDCEELSQADNYY